jgi:signal peptidase I
MAMDPPVIPVLSSDAVPRRLVGQDDRADEREALLLDRGTVWTLHQIDGRRSIAEIAGMRDLSRVGLEVARLVELGLVSVDPPSPEPAPPGVSTGDPVLVQPRPALAVVDGEEAEAAPPVEAQSETRSMAGTSSPRSERVALGLEIAKAVATAAILFLVIRSAVQTYRVEGTSMTPSFRPGQLLLINRMAYWRTDETPFDGLLPYVAQGPLHFLFGGPQRGEVAVFRSPVETNRDLIKRVIAVPGDTVLIVDGRVVVNGRAWDEPYVSFHFPAGFAYPEDGRPLTVPEGNYFVLGDNRPNSFDSHMGWFVPADNLAGRAWLAYWPPSSWGVVAVPAIGWEPSLEPEAIERSQPSGNTAPADVAEKPRPEPPFSVVATVSALATALASSATPSPSAPVLTQVTPTGVPTPAPSVLPTAVPTSAAAPRMVLEERFGDNRRGWVHEPGGAVWLGEGGYHLRAREPGRFVAVGAPLPSGEALRDVVLAATFRKLGGPPGGGYGLIVRAEGLERSGGLHQGGRYYVLEVGDRGEVGIWRREQDRWVDLVPWTAARMVRPGTEPNELLALAVGPRLTLLVNGMQAASVEDAALTAGSVGVFVGGDFNQVLLQQLTVHAAT